GRSTPPRPPAPVSTPTTGVTRQAARDTAAGPPDTNPQVVIARPDSVLTRQAVAVFGNSTVPPTVDSAAAEGPTWDIDVRSYETHRRVEFYVNAFRGSA